MSVEEIGHTIQSRIPWSVAIKILRANELEPSQGWERTLERLAGNEDDDTQEVLEEIVKQHFLCGEKSVRFYKLDRQQIAGLRTAIEQIQVEDHSFVRSYPNTLDEDELVESDDEGPVLIAKETKAAGTALIYGSVRSLEERTVFKVGQLEPAVRARFTGYSEVVAVKRILLQAMDVLWVPQRGSLVEIRIDDLTGTRQEAIDTAHLKLERLTGQLMGSHLPHALNLFPIIDRIYSTHEEGVVVELAFATRTASLKHEKMRRRGLCLRSERYHVGGKNAVRAQIDPFRISVEWSVPITGRINSKPELGLHSSARVAAMPDPVLYEAQIRRCVGNHDYEFVVGKIHEYLSAE